MENKQRYFDDQEPSSSKTPTLNRLDDGVPEKTPESSLCSNDEPQQGNKSEFSKSISRSEKVENIPLPNELQDVDGKKSNSTYQSATKQRIKKISIFSNDDAVLNKKNSAEIVPKRKLSGSDADTPPAKREKASEIGTTDKGHGLKNTLHGVTYQLKLLILILLHAAKEMKVNKGFKCFIKSEDPKYGKFDDIVFCFKNGDKWYTLCIQAKHKEDDTKSITWNDFISTAKDNPYSISKYFNSCPQQKTDGTKDDDDDESTETQSPTLVLCTNIGLEQEVKDLMVDGKHSFENSLVCSFFNSLNSETYKFDLDKVRKKNDGKLLDILAENSDFKELSKQLAVCIFKAEIVDFRNPLFKRNRVFIQNKIATNDLISKETKNIFKVNEDFFNDPDAVEFQKSFETEYRKLTEASTKQKPNNQDIWRDIRSKGIKVHKVAITTETETILPKQMEQLQIENFFKSFIIASNTCNESELSGLIVNELKQSDHLPPDTQETIASEIARDHLLHWILEWIKDKGSKSLKEEDFNEFFYCLAARLRYLHFEGMSKDFCGCIQNMDLKCKTEILQQRRLYKNLDLWVSEPCNGGDKVDIFESSDPSWVVYDTVEFFKSNLNYLFFKVSQFQQQKRDIMKVFIDMNFPLILVIEGKSLSNVKEYIEGRVEGMSTETFKKIILIDQTFSASEAERDLLFRDLTDKSKEKVFIQTEFISFFGTKTSTSELIHDEDKLNFVLDVLQLTSGTGIKCNNLKETYEKIKDMFIHRKWEQCDEKLRITSSWSFWHYRQEGATLTKLFPGSEPQAKISYDIFLNYNNLDIEKYNRALLHRNSEYTDPPGVDGNTQDQVQPNSSDLDKTDLKMHVIFNEAGSGKSFYFTWLASYLQDVRPSWWIVKFNLNEYSMEFDQMQKSGQCENMDELVAIRFLFRLIYLAFHVENRLLVVSDEKSSHAQTIAEALVFSNGCLKLDKNKMKTVSSEELILLRIFEHKFNSKKIVILMDGFDEIAPDYKIVVLKLLSRLKTFDGIRKVYLSSRPYGLRTEIETTLEDCACYRLLRFDIEDQYEFIHRYLLKHFDAYQSSNETKQVKTCSVVFEILRWILRDLMDIPLFMSMGVELLMSMVKNYINIEQETISKEIVEVCENSFEPLSMVESFVVKKLNIVNIEKTGTTVASATTVAAKRITTQNIEIGKDSHSILALYTIMYNDVKKLLSNEQQNSALQYMENVKNGLEKSGLIEGVASNRPIFNHMLFAEYFAALWFYSNQNVTGVKDFLKRKVYETNDRREIRQLIDRMICKNSPLHMAILDGSKMKMDIILTKEPHLINARDEWGRTPLHMALSLRAYLDGEDIIEFLLDLVDKEWVNLKDTYFEWFTLDYAYCAVIRHRYRAWDGLLSLLNKGASIDTPAMLSRFSKRKEIVELLVIEFYSDRICKSNFETFFTKVVQVLGPKQVLYHIVWIEVFENFYIYMQQIEDNLSSLECCIIVDSLMFKILMENSNNPSLEHANKRHLTLAFKFHSINVLQYFIIDRPFDLSAIKDNFEQELCVLLVYMQSDEQKFKSLFHDYCSRYKITCLEETPMDKSKNWNREFSSRIRREYFPTKFEIRDDPGIDTGSEFLISRALQLDNASAVEYLLQKTKTNLDNRFIMKLLKNFEVKWCCLSCFHFLLDNSTDLSGTDENGRNLLHFAADYGDLNLLKCLINHYGFKPSEINTKENNWNAFFYCASSESRNVEDRDNRKNIFVYMLEKDPVDCFGQLDAKGKSIFYYASKTNRKISDYIFEKKFKMKLSNYNSDQISDLMKFLKPSGFDVKDILKYLQYTHLNDPKKCKSICDDLKSINELQYRDEKGRNLLQIACLEGWLTLTECLIEHYGFDAKEINEKEHNWNAFFYCVVRLGNDSNRLKVFTYLMEKDPFDCFGQLDSMGKSVFYYATCNNEEIGIEIFKRECKLQEHLPIEERIPVLMERLQNTDLDSYSKIDYFEQNQLIDEESVNIICDYLKITGELNYKNEETGRNLLHIACDKGLLTLTKCLIEHYGFDAKVINEKEYNWNAFFYCVEDRENDYHKLEIFTYLMEKDPFDCFGQLDSKGKSVFNYAIRKIKQIGVEILKRECKLQKHLPIEQRIPVLMEKIQKSIFSIEEILKYLEANLLTDENSIKIFCDCLKKIGELNNRDEETGRNLLHIACMEGWLTLTKCLVEHYGFDAKEINEKENNWNAFFYCASDWGNVSNKLEIFSYLMEKDPFDCFDQLDSWSYNVFEHVLFEFNVPFAEYIIRNDLPTNDSVLVKEWASTFSKRLSESKLTEPEIDRFLTGWKRKSSLEAKDEIYLEIRSNLEWM